MSPPIGYLSRLHWVKIVNEPAKLNAQSTTNVNQLRHKLFWIATCTSLVVVVAVRRKHEHKNIYMYYYVNYWGSICFL